MHGGVEIDWKSIRYVWVYSIKPWVFNRWGARAWISLRFVRIQSRNVKGRRLRREDDDDGDDDGDGE